MKIKNTILTLLLLFLFSSILTAQKSDKKIFRAASQQAEKHYDNGEYQKAATAYKTLIENNPKRVQSYHFLNAAVSFTELKNEEKSAFYLNGLAAVATSSEIETVKSAPLFQQYDSEKWWDKLMTDFDNRMAALINHHKTLKIFNHNKKFTYSAIRISAKGDTLANTRIHLIPDGTGWGNPAASSQSQILCHYEFSKQDSIDHIGELRETVMERFWLRVDTTGIIENEEEIWMHPFRYNEFFKTEIAPFPVVHFPINHETTLEARSKIVIMRNWGTYSPTMTTQEYFYAGIEEKNYPFSGDIECHKFMAYGHNSKHGISHLEYFFHEKYGFTEMNYLTYDNEVIQFKIEELLTVND